MKKQNTKKYRDLIICPNCFTRSDDKSFVYPMVTPDGNGYHCGYCKTDFSKETNEKTKLNY